MSVLLLTLPLLWAQVNPAPNGPAANPPQAAPAQAAGAPAKAPGPPAAAGAATPAAAANPAPAMPVPPPLSKGLMTVLAWTYIAGDPGFTAEGLLGGFLTWMKAVSLLCLVGWILSWLVIGVKERVIGRGGWVDYVFLAALIMTPLTVMLRVLETVEKLPVYRIGPIGLTVLAALACVLLYTIWVEVAVWRTIRRLSRGVDSAVLVGVHVALALGLAVGVCLQQLQFLDFLFGRPLGTLTWIDGLIYGLRISLTYMGYVVGLRILGLFFSELIAVRGRRLYAIASLSIHEANRRMWAPWVVITVFLLVLAFTHWFLQPPRAAEMARLYVGTLTLLCSVLLTVMVTILTPLSLPTDIQQQTIYTVVSKPVRRLEMIWGRMIGYMLLVTVLIVLFGGISLLYLRRTVGITIDQTEVAALKAKGFELRLMSPLNNVSDVPGAGRNLIVVAAVNNGLQFRIFEVDGRVVVNTEESRLTNQAPKIEEFKKQLEDLWPPHRLTRSDEVRVKAAVASIVDYTQATRENPAEFKLLTEQADQLRTRLQARVPVKGSLSFLDSRGLPHAMGIDVGGDQNMREPRSHIEGATPSAAIWSFGMVPDPFTPPGRQPRTLNRRVPVGDFLRANTIEWDLDQIYQLQEQIQAAQVSKSKPDVSASVASRLDATIARNQKELDRIQSDYEAKKRQSDEADGRAAEAETAERKDEAQALRQQIAELHSPMVKVEMSFNVYRTTKGKIGEPVYAEIQAFNPRTQARFEGDVFPIKEYYTNRVQLPPSLLAGSGGALRIEIRCLSPTQYLGMAESDLYLLPQSGNFGVNYMKGLFGIWLQAMVLTAIGVCAGTFLSWPVALLTTIAFFVAGQLAFAFLVDFTRQAVLGGGPFESLIRLLTHDNQMSDLAPTAGVVLAKTLDSLVMPVMSMLVFIVPNFNALDVTNMVADGFAVSWGLLGLNILLALAYALPFSLAGYFILKNREVAA